MDFNPQHYSKFVVECSGLSCSGCAFVSRLRYLDLESLCIFDVDFTENKSDVTKLPFEEYKRYLLT